MKEDVGITEQTERAPRETCMYPEDAERTKQTDEIV